MVQVFRQPAHIQTVRELISKLNRNHAVSTDVLVQQVRLRHSEVSRAEIAMRVLEEAISQNLAVVWGTDRDVEA